jgi:hypothetical protein
MSTRIRAGSQLPITLANRPKPICAACAEGHHEQPTRERCSCPCHGTLPALRQVAA